MNVVIQNRFPGQRASPQNGPKIVFLSQVLDIEQSTITADGLGISANQLHPVIVDRVMTSGHLNATINIKVKS